MATVPNLVAFKTDPYDVPLQVAVGVVRQYAIPTDLVAPTATLISPWMTALPLGSTPIVVDVKDETALRRAFIFVEFSDSPEEVIWDGYVFSDQYIAASTVATVTGGKRFSIVRGGGWRSDPNVVVTGQDTSGNELTPTSSAFTYAAPPLTETTPPAVMLVSPLPGTTITTRTPLVIDVTDLSLKSCLLTVRFSGSNSPEVAYDGQAFAEPYRGSTLESVTHGFRFTLQRAGGWLGPPTVRVYAADSYGNEA